MIFNQISVFTIIAIFFFSQHNGPCVCASFTVDQSFGMWYNMGETVLGEPERYAAITCLKLNVTKSDNETNVIKLVYHKVINGQSSIEEGYGKVNNSELHFIFPKRSAHEFVYTITRNSNGEELILRSTHDEFSNIMISRKPTISTQTKSAFDRIATDLEADVVNFSQNDCPENRNGSGRK